MIGYVTLGTQNLERGAAFYDALLGELGATRSLEAENYVAWATATAGPMLSLMLPFDEQPASVGNGTMVALALMMATVVAHKPPIDWLPERARHGELAKRFDAAGVPE